MLRAAPLFALLTVAGSTPAAAVTVEVLPIAGFGPAVLSVPAGAAPRPLVFAAHGSYDRPEWECEVLGAVFGDRAFVLCLRGTLRWDTPPEPELRRYYYRGLQALERELDAAIAALRARYPGRVAEGPGVYVGFSQGAILGVPLLQRRARQFAAALLIEGGHRWTAAGARSYVAGGGRRVLLACGRAGCLDGARGAAALLGQAGAAARVVHGAGAGHSYDGPVQAALLPEAGWLLGE